MPVKKAKKRKIRATRKPRHTPAQFGRYRAITDKLGELTFLNDRLLTVKERDLRILVFEEMLRVSNAYMKILLDR